MKRFLLSGALAVALASFSAAQQHQNAYIYTHYNTPVTGVYSFDQYLRVEEKANASFWPALWKWDGVAFGGYFGLQTNGSGPQGQPLGDTVLFSCWDANAADPAPGSLAGTFGGEGTGYTVRRSFPIRTDRFYRLRIWRLSTEAAGHWWGAWIMDTKNGHETFLGSIRTDPAHATINGQSLENFSEYFGQAQPTCDDVPVSTVRWSLPLARSGGPDVVGPFSDFVRGSCTGGVSLFNAFPAPAPPIPMSTFLGSAIRGVRPGAVYLPDVHVVVTLGGPR
jgi:hypothetical protein